MAAEIKKHVKYTKDLAVVFFNYCQLGLSLTQIAENMGVDKQLLIKWSKDEFKFEWQNAWIRGQQACQSYHEALLDDMIKNKGKYDTASKQLHAKRMAILFDDWKDRPLESKVEVSQTQLSPDKMKEEITKLLSKTHMKNVIEVDSFGSQADSTQDDDDNQTTTH